MNRLDARTRDRIKAALAAGAIQAVFGYVLLSQLAMPFLSMEGVAIKVFEVAEPPRPAAERPKPSRAGADKPKDEAAPPNIEAEPVEIAAPPPIILPPVPLPIVAPPIAGTGDAPVVGAAETPGPGTGAGGEGAGRGGGGEGEGGFTPPRWLRGRLRDSDIPRDVGDAGLGEQMTVRFTVQTNGRATDCGIEQSSGNARLDEATCRAIERRYRFRPALDEDDQPIAITVVEDHRWHRHED